MVLLLLDFQVHLCCCFFVLLREVKTFVKFKVHIVSLEILMLENWTLSFLVGTNFVKTVHIELSYKRKEVIVLEVLAEDFCG
jgi:hypothetical protein